MKEMNIERKIENAQKIISVINVIAYMLVTLIIVMCVIFCAVKTTANTYWCIHSALAWFVPVMSIALAFVVGLVYFSFSISRITKSANLDNLEDV